MKAPINVRAGVPLESLVMCFATECMYHGVNVGPTESRGPWCNLKCIVMKSGGECDSFVNKRGDQVARRVGD